MSNWKVIEVLELHGGRCDGERRRDTEPVEMLSVQTQTGETALYRRLHRYEQLRGLHMAEPLCRLWSYEWVSTP